jgi:hypothetical protein
MHTVVRTALFSWVCDRYNPPEPYNACKSSKVFFQSPTDSDAVTALDIQSGKGKGKGKEKRHS